MNSIIKELALEAGFPTAGFDKDGVAIQNSREIEKFARLIAYECATLAETAEPYKAGDLIKRYFGLS